jgi:DNA polymerase
MIILDFETYGEVDLPVVGAYRYARDPATDVLLLAYGRPGEAVRVWTPGDPMPAGLIAALAAGEDVLAHNAAFDRNLWEWVLMPRYGFPPVAGRWLDSRTLCALVGLPRSLEQAANALGLEQRKAAEGKRLIQLFSMPHARGLFRGRVRPEDAPEDWRRFVEYGVQDVRTTITLVERLAAYLPQLDRDHPCWEADYRMACRGILADLDLAKAVAAVAEPRLAELTAECARLTGGLAPGQVQALLAWLRDHGLLLESLGEIEIAEALATPLPGEVRRVLELRLEGSKTSWRKVYAIREAATADGRLHDQLAYAGTHTYRWAGRGVQLQNLPRPKLKAAAIGDAVAVLQRDPADFGLLFAAPLEALSSLIRSLLRAPDGLRLAVCDYSKIEVVVLGWLAGDEAMLEALRRGEDLYRRLASRIYKVEEAAVTKEQRHTGKGGILGGGYGAGWRAFLESCRKQGLTIGEALARATIDAYREQHAPVVRFWAALEQAALRAVGTGKPQPVGPHLTFFREDRWLFCRLPSGRNLAWFEPKIARVEKYGEPALELRFTAVGKHGRPVPSHTFGGRLCENVVSSTARDLLAESLVAAERDGLNPVLTVHDELVCEGPPGVGEALAEVMLRRPAWAPDLPIAVEGQEGDRYAK